MRRSFLLSVVCCFAFIDMYCQDWIKLANAPDSTQYLANIKPAKYGLAKNNAEAIIGKYVSNDNIDGDSLYKLLANWNHYPTPGKTGIICEFQLTLDTHYRVPYLVYIPKDYNPKRPSALLLYFKGGWMNRKELPGNYAREIIKDNPTFAYLDANNIIEVFPVLESKLAIYGNYGYHHLTALVASTKRILNVDDNKVFLAGFSDGGKTVYNAYSLLATPFAGFYSINGMIVSPMEFYNLKNRPMFSFVAENDELTHPLSIRSNAVFANSIGANWHYQLMPGKKHSYRSYQSEVLPLLFAHLKTQSRNPIPPSISYRSSGNYTEFYGIDWLQVRVNTKRGPSSYHKIDSVHTNGSDGDERHYTYGNKTGQVEAHYFDNTFTFTASMVDEIDIYISPLMVNMNRPVKIIVNGSEVFSDRVEYSKKFMAERFRKFFDRQQVWVNAITVKVP